LQYELRYLELEARATAWIESSLNGPEIEQWSARLKAWALIRGATITGRPLLVMRSPLITQVHLPIEGNVRPHPETGVGFLETHAGPAILAGPVHILDIRALDREVRSEFGAHCEFAGPPEFHDWDARGRFNGWLHYPVSKLPTVRPTMLAVPDLGMTPVANRPARERVVLAS